MLDFFVLLIDVFKCDQLWMALIPFLLMQLQTGPETSESLLGLREQFYRARFDVHTTESTKKKKLRSYAVFSATSRYSAKRLE
jgi:hypothetical protein